MGTKKTSASDPVDTVVIRDLAIADSKYVLSWLLQIDEIRRDLGYGQPPIPENIVGLCKRALRLFDAALLDDVESADPIPLSDVEINELVKKVCE